MNLLRYLAQLPWVDPLGWTLIHFLWQGALTGGTLWLALRAARRASPNVRYLLALSGLLLSFLAPIATFIHLAKPFAGRVQAVPVLTNFPDTAIDPSRSNVHATLPPANTRPVSPDHPSLPSTTTTGSSQPTPTATPALSKPALHWLNRWNLLSWAVAFWFTGVCCAALRLLGGWLRIQLWKQQSGPAHLTAPWLEETFRRLAQRIGAPSKARLLLSRRSLGPLALGVIRPVVILPFSLLTSLPKEHLEAILLHELAHLRRHDYLVNLLQSAVEVILFYHPAIWWIGRELRQIREECCDALAAEHGSGRLAYAKALTALETFRAPTPLAAPGATTGSLLLRIRRLLGQHEPESILGGRHAAWLTALGIATLIAACLLHSITIETPEKTGTIKPPPSGFVSDELGHPVPGARVWLYYQKNPWESGKGTGEEITTDPQGRFAFKKPLPFQSVKASKAADHYHLFAAKPGKAPAWATITSGDPDPATFSLVLTPPSPKTYQVVDPAGQPIQGARVWLRRVSAQMNRTPRFTTGFSTTSDPGLATAITDENGFATLADLPNGHRSVTVSHPGYEEETWRRRPQKGVLRIPLKPEASVEGRVTDPIGLPVEGAVVWLAPKSPKSSYHPHFLARTDKAGRYRVEKIWSHEKGEDQGRYKIGIWHPRLVAIVRELDFAPAEAKTGVHLKAIPATEIVGKLTDPATGKPVVGGSVVIASELSGERTYWSDENGAFSAPVATGPVAIASEQPPPGTYLVEDYLNGYQITSRITTTAFGGHFPVTVTTKGKLRPLGNFALSITLPDGTPAPRASFYTLFPGQRFNFPDGWTGSSLRKTYTDERGEYQTNTFPSGLPFWTYAESQDGKAGGYLPPTEPKDGRPLHLQLQPLASTTVQLIDGDGKALQKTEVSVRPVFQDDEIFFATQKITTDNNGNLKLSKVVPDVTYSLSINNNKTNQRFLLPSNRKPDASPAVLNMSGRYLVRLLSATGEPLKIVRIQRIEFSTERSGQPIRWGNSNLPIPERRSDSEVYIEQKQFWRAKQGNLIEFRIETDGGLVVTATAIFPGYQSELIEAKAIKPIGQPKAQPDPTLPGVGPDELIGRIVDAQGQPISHATVTPLSITWLSYKPLISNQEGIFRTSKPQGQTYRSLEIAKEGFATVWLTDLPFGRGFKVTLQSTTRLRGRLVKADGTPAGIAAIKLETDVDSTHQDVYSHKISNLVIKFRSQPDGEYDFPVEPGLYRYQITTDSGDFLRGEINLKENEIRSLPEKLQPGISVTLTVVDVESGKPVPGIPIRVDERVGPNEIGIKEDSERVTDEHGIVRWDNLMSGPASFTAIRISHGHGTPNSPYARLPYTRWWSDTMTNTWSRIHYQHKLPQKDEGNQSLEFDLHDGFQATIQVERGVEVSGTVVDPEGQPVEGLTVSVVPQEGRRHGLLKGNDMRTDDKGVFHSYIRAGNGVVYVLCAYPAQHSGQPALLYTNVISEPFQSKPGDKLKFRLQMQLGAWVTGRLVDQEGKPVPNERVGASAQDFMDSPYAQKRAVTDAQGRFRLGPLRPTNYEIHSQSEWSNSTQRGEIPVSIQVEGDKEIDIGDLVFSKEDRQLKSPVARHP